MKKDIFNNLKDYNNELEKILEHKDFSENVKNLLLNMLYKIETSYSDYKKTKVVVPEKWVYIQQILDKIDTKCKKISIIKNNVKEENNIQINKEKGEIKVLQNEKLILEAILKISENDILIDDKYYVAKEPLKEFFKNTYIDNKMEVIRDFDGWNWYRYKNEISNLISNLIYNNLLILVGNKEIEKVINNKNEKFDNMLNLKTKLKINYNKKLADEIIYTTMVIVSQIYYAKDNQNIIEECGKLYSEREKTVDKEKYLEELSTNKKQKFKDIYRIDDILSNKQKLEKEFVKRNKKGQTLFSINTLILILQKEKDKLIEEIDEISMKMNPKNFTKKQNELEERIKLLEDIQNTKIENNIFYMQKLFIEALNIKLDKCETKKNLLDLIYMIRYYNLLDLNSNVKVFEEKEIEIELNNLINKTIKKAIEEKVINLFFNDITSNIELYKKIMTLKSIDIENLQIMIEKNGLRYILSIYDDESIEYSIEIDKIQIQGMKINKKIKLFN